MKYMLDTNIVIYAINKRPESVLRRLTAHDPDEICISSITLAELEFGCCKSSRPEQNRLALLAFLSPFQIVPFGVEAARDYGEIRHALSRAGRIIGANDLLIAAHARALGLILITNNTGEFDRIEGLKVENWV